MTFTIGLVPSPGVAHKLVDNAIPKVQQHLHDRIKDVDEWHFESKVDLLIGSAEDVHESIDKAAELKKEYEWDFVICITDLPSISGNKVVISDFNSEKQVSMLSLPALGWINLERKLVKSMTALVEQLYHNNTKERPKVHPLIKPKAVDPREDESSKRRYINRYFILGWLQLILGLTRANEPWRNLFNFKKIISVAFATGTYVSIFSMPWELSVQYSTLRFIVLMIISILGMAGWLLYAHQLFEEKTSKSQRVYRYVYNATTLLTLVIITLMNYVVLYVLLSISISLFVPVGLFNSWTSANPDFTFINYLKLLWFVSSLGLLAGAMGSTVENEEKIRRITYSYRQYHRYKEAQQEEKEKKEQQSQDVSQHDVEQSSSNKESNDDEQYEGKKQDHREEDDA
ncbi:5,10-methylene-tetrahydrofolate dehydrogenase [Staphylococcus haemolyticus]|uniref:5,10-methylene-tetrahydrofolate dehydrogenase n=1 Tax=Staphylococcus haemolyticus TaxID=1283 RepID=UPI000CB32675|nr:5,10-methylene-tetrahydrofolate dehydrogenase [Staphylococcus haemolyticus]MCH4388467.1 5,10-methylene-tetrahydrofolate dehydrogenase [Staphylococcus haemolyticus]MCH4534622.1 5,10-methylene-tetrahydrofolate dehydrogenase [Staphylococcus haemolyticus]PNH24265.1 5,10-methylene-tetrahydrofolate dehydrogenase [Staphylococcus haemolyticus]